MELRGYGVLHSMLAPSTTGSASPSAAPSSLMVSHWCSARRRGQDQSVTESAARPLPYATRIFTRRAAPHGIYHNAPFCDVTDARGGTSCSSSLRQWLSDTSDPPRRSFVLRNKRRPVRSGGDS